MSRPGTIAWDKASRTVCLIDQTCLPGRLELICADSVDRLATAIRRLEVRGAPALGVAGGYGVALAAEKTDAPNLPTFIREVQAQAETLRRVRPTAVNLSWGIDRVIRVLDTATSIAEARFLTLAEAEKLASEDAAVCHRIGDNGAALLPDSCTVLTHCNAGGLACTEWGTALGVIRSAVKAGKAVKVIACETRPLLQGARLTAWELSEDNIPVTVIPDSAAAYLMKRGLVDLVVVGADRITRDAVFNKIGTYTHAITARYHDIPFYVAAPVSTFDPMHIEADIEVELRGREEVAKIGDRDVVPEDVPVLNYAFDATPLELLTAVITESGIYRNPGEMEKVFIAARVVQHHRELP